MPTVRPFPAGGYRFINHQFQYSGGVVAEPGFGIEPHAAPGTMLCTEEFLSELDERNQVLFIAGHTGPDARRGVAARR